MCPEIIICFHHMELTLLLLKTLLFRVINSLFYRTIGLHQFIVLHRFISLYRFASVYCFASVYRFESVYRFDPSVCIGLRIER
jgi:hypothetical protein